MRHARLIPLFQVAEYLPFEIGIRYRDLSQVDMLGQRRKSVKFSGANPLQRNRARIHEIGEPLQRLLAHEKQRPPRTLQYVFAQGPVMGPWGGALFDERGTPV